MNSCNFSKNTAYTGGALSVDDVTYNLWWEGDSKVDITRCNFDANSAEDGAGAVYLSGPSEWAAIVSYTFHASLDTCTFNENSAKQGAGGAIFAEQLRTLALVNSTMQRNMAGSAGALATRLIHSAVAANSAFVANNASTGDAGAIR